MSAFKQSMRKLGVRAGLLAGASAAVLAISGISAGSAMATPTCPSQTTSIAGKGSSLQKVAQEKWTAGYNGDCPSGPHVSYTSTGSGPGLTAFRFNGSGTIETSQAFVGSDDGPTTAQIENAEAATEGGKASGANPIIIPVAETAISVPIHPPTGCTITGISWANLNKLFAGTLKLWTELAHSGTCSGEISRVVRNEGSGTTYQFKNYLSTLETTTGIKASGPGCSLGTWESLEEIGTEEKPNITWPECTGTTKVVRAAGGGAVAEYVANHENTVGYAALPDAKAKSATVASLQNGTVGETITYGAPGKEEESGKIKVSNCGERIYTVPVGGREGESGESINWSKVFGASPKVGGSLYPLCTLTYDIGWSSYAKAGYGANATPYREVFQDYLSNFILGSEGQAVDRGNWYQPVPTTANKETNVAAAATLAASKLGN